METNSVEYYPIFEDNQVLTAGQLNAVASYLERQERLTRRLLLGVGLACGLEVRLQEAGRQIEVDRGCGVTSEGFLIFLEGQDGGPATYPYFTPFALQEGEEYPPFFVGDEQINLFRLRESKIKGAEALSELPEALTSYILLLYLRCLDLDEKNCVEFDCDEKGTRRQFELIPLLVGKEDARRIIYQEREANMPGPQNPNALTLEELVNGRFRLPGINLPRFHPENRRMDTYKELYALYDQMADHSLAILRQGIREAYRLYGPLLRAVAPNASGVENLIGARLDQHRQQLQQRQPYAVQYFHDLLCDIADTYNEFIELAFDVFSACCPPPPRFPKHLRLGELQTAGCPPSPYRHRWLSAPIHEEQSEKKTAMQALFRKMLLLIDRFVPPLNFEALRITPSRALDYPLSQKAIPFYYQLPSPLLQHWNPELLRRCRFRENLSYHAQNYASNPDIPHVLTPLQFGLNRYGFYRIEGHLGQSYNQAMRDILRQRDRHNLAFDLVLLKMGRDASNTNLDGMRCSFQDLEAVCQAWKKELECLAKDTLSGLTGIRVTNTLQPASKAIGFVRTEKASSYPGLQSQLYQSYQKPLVERVVDEAVVKEKDTFGYYVNESYKSQAGSGNDYARVALEKLKADNAAVNELSGADYEIAVEQPVQVATHLIGYLQRVEGNCDELSLEEIEDARKELMTRARKYLQLLEKYEQTSTRKVQVDKTALLRLMTILIGNCSLEQLRVIKEEIERRKEELRQLNLFSNYLEKHPGLDHAGGVPVGGTFVLVYHGRDREEDPENTVIIQGELLQGRILSGRITLGNGEPLVGIQVLIPGTAIGAVTNINGQFRLYRSQLPISLRFLYPGLQLEDVTISETPFKISVGLGDGGNGEGDAPDINTVIADFYLPYNCCSDCPSIDYILPPEKQPVGLELDPLEYCVPAEGGGTETSDFTVTPEDGEVKGPGVEAVNGGYHFNPATALGTANNRMVSGFTVNDEPVALQVMVFREPVAAFEMESSWRNRADGTRVLHIILTNFSSPYATSFEWKIPLVLMDSGEVREELIYTSNNIQETPEFDLAVQPDASFDITLIARHGPCSDENAETFESGNPQVGLELDPREFCQSTEERPHFKVTPESGTVTGPGVQPQDDDSYIFDPTSVALDALQTELTGYAVNGILLEDFSITVYRQPVARFDCRVEWEEVDEGAFQPRLILQSTSDNAASVKWRINEEESGFETEFDEPEFNQLIDNLVLKEPRRIIFQVELVAVNGPCTDTTTGTCESTPILIDIYRIENNEEVPVSEWRFSNDDGRRYLLRLRPGQGTLKQVAGGNLGLTRIVSSPAREEFSFSPGKKDPGNYLFNYSLDDGNGRSFTIEVFSGDTGGGGIVGPDNPFRGIVDNFGVLDGLRKNPLFSTILSPATSAVREMVNINARLLKDAGDKNAMQKWLGGGNNEVFAASMEKATTDSTKRLLSLEGGGASTKKEAYLLQWYRLQIAQTFRFVAVLNDDLKRTDPLSKLITTIQNQVKKLQKQDVPIDRDGFLLETLQSIAPELEGKSFAAGRLQEMIELLKS